MYKIIGADGREYGPISAEVVRRWIAEGRANGDTKILSEGSTIWITISQVPELMTAPAGVTAPPASPYTPPLTAPIATANRADVEAPANGLIATAILGYLATACGAGWNLFGHHLAGDFGMPHSGGNAELERFINMFSGSMAVVSAIMGLVISTVILIGAMKMKKCESHGWAVAAAILAAFPCVSPCCLVGMPLGIWALIVLFKPEVKALFR
jgi:hypothetical protein